MSQDRESGTAASKWGAETAHALAKALGAKKSGKKGNEFLLGDAPVTIKCARRRTTSVGCTMPMLSRVDLVFGAFEQDNGSFELWSLPPRIFRAHMHRSKTSPKVGLVSRGVFRSQGSLVATLLLRAKAAAHREASLAERAKLAARQRKSPVFDVLTDAKSLAQKYRDLTGKPLGITGEVAEFEASRLLGLQLAPARQAGYDAIERRGRKKVLVQIKGRCILADNPGQRLGRIDVAKPWDTVMLVLLDERLDAFEIYEADREEIVAALKKPGSKVRARGALSVSKFKTIGRLRWKRQEPTSA